ncbi:peptidase [Enterococcus villorum]|uniref:Peptidase n=1 Tax=Enterococcus villorum TaxID=112904 RepID=A0A1V8YF07_9ENTE|nr:VWA domain-containing protein [Enterococcus villorum]OQO71138.1 peptidase [Enterococcus villorum]OQO73855.1 peptidase [Enterococcus villorum]
MRKSREKYMLSVILIFGLIIFLIGLTAKVSFAQTYDFNYTDANGQYLTNGKSEGNTHNYDYGQAPEASFDEENYVNYGDKAYVKKSVKETEATQGLFDVTLDVKGNQIGTPIDLVLVIDYSSSMNGEKLVNTLKGLQQFEYELTDSLANGNIRVGIVAYNRFVYTTNGFSTDTDYLENFLKNTAESHSGTFIQKGLIEGQRTLLEQSRPEAEKILIHIGDNSANRSYLPAVGATEYPNNGEIMDYNGYHTANYVQDFQTNSEKYYTTSSSSSDANAIPVSSSVVTDATLGTIVSIKNSGLQCYSIATAPSARGEYIGRNIATEPQNYLTTDENLNGLGSALTEIANHIDKTIPNGTITDPMGENILLQGAGSFDEQAYQLIGWRKNDQGVWEKAEDVLENVSVSEANQTITVKNIALGANERITLTYQVRLNTEMADFKGETWYLCNGRTTLAPESGEELLDFPIPSIKAPVIDLHLTKKWENVPVSEIPEAIQYVIHRNNVVDPANWQSSDILSLTKQVGYQATLKEIPVENKNVVLPKYNNHGEDFIYQIEEVNVPDGFESTLSSEGNTFVLTNTKKETEPSTTEPSTTEPTTESSTPEPSTTETSTSESSTTEPSITESSATGSNIVVSNTEGSNQMSTSTVAGTTVNTSTVDSSMSEKNKPLRIASTHLEDSKEDQLPKTNDGQSSLPAFLGTILVGLTGWYFIRKIS